MDRGVVKFKFGGVERSVPVKIALAPAIEEATGCGIVALVRRMGDGSARVTESLAVIRQALASIGQEYKDAELFDYLERDGILHVHTCAAKIMSALLKPPANAEKAAGKKLPAPN